jgi:hypothetical protein
VDSDGEVHSPEGYWLDLTPPALSDAERPGTCASAMVAIRNDIAGRLLRPPALIAEQLFIALPDHQGVGHVTRGGVMVPLSPWQSHPVAAATFRPYDGGEGIALTNITPDEGGRRAIAVALAALFAGEPTRSACRDRAGSFASASRSAPPHRPGPGRWRACSCWRLRRPYPNIERR